MGPFRQPWVIATCGQGRATLLCLRRRLHFEHLCNLALLKMQQDAADTSVAIVAAVE